jgi:SPP1 gp7 family putative phage head morphogenesis protein
MMMTINGIYTDSTFSLKAETGVLKAAPEELRKPRAVVPYTDHFSDHPTTGLTPAKLRALLHDAEYGSQRSQIEFFEDVLERDGVISGAFGTRKLAVTKHEFEFIPREGFKGKGKKQAEFLNDVARNLSINQLQYSYDADLLDFESLLWTTLDAVSMGIAIPELTWDQDGREWRIVEARHVSPKHLMFGKPGSVPWNPYDVRLRTEEEPTNGIPLPPFRYLLHQYRGFSGYPARAGLLRTLAWPYLCKWYGLEGAVMFVELYGVPMRIGKYDPNTPTDTTILAKALRELGRDASAMISNDMEIEFKGVEKGQDLIHPDFVNMWDNQALIAILGQSGTTVATPGKLGENKEHGDVRQDIKESDAKALEKTVQLRFVTPLCLFNQGEIMCDFRIKYQKEEDQNTKAERYAKITSFTGVPESHLRTEFNLPEAKDGEASTTLHTQAQAGGGQPVPFKRTLVAGRSNRAATRRAATIKASNDLTSAINSGASKAATAYQILLEGTDTATDEKSFLKAVKKNQKAFKAAFEPIISEGIDKAYKLANDVMGIKPKTAKATRDMFEKMVVCAGDTPNVGIKFNVKNSVAQDFLKFQKFFITQVESEQITNKLWEYARTNLDRAMEDGLTRAEFRNELMDNAGIGSIKPWHAELIFTNNLATAHSASKLYAMNENKKFFPAWQFLAVMDNSTTPECEALNERIFANSDTSYAPPLHHGCRSELSPIDQLEMNDENYSVEKSGDTGIEPQAGWTNGAVENFTNWAASMVKDYPSLKDTINNYED